MTDQVRNIVHTIGADATRSVAVFEHDLGPDVIVHFRDGSSGQLTVVVIG